MAKRLLLLRTVAPGHRAARSGGLAWPRRLRSAARRATACSFTAHALCAFAFVLHGAWQPALLYPPPQGPTSLPQTASAAQQQLVAYAEIEPAPDGATAVIPREQRPTPPVASDLEVAAAAPSRSTPATPLGTLPALATPSDADTSTRAIGEAADSLPRAVAASQSPSASPAAPAEPLPRQDVARDVQSQVESLASTAAAALQGALVNAEPLGETNPEPVYPREALAQRLAGLVLIRAWIDERGRVVRADLHESSGHALLDEAALDAVRRWRFAPARLDGEPTSCEVAIPVRFVIPE